MDATIYGGELARLITLHAELKRGATEAARDLDRAEHALRNAEARSVAVAAAARVGGRDEPATTDEQDARDALALAEREHQVAAAAVIAAGEAIGTEIAENGDRYRGRLGKRIDAAEETGRNALGKLEEALADRTTARAYRAWLDRPGGGANLREPGAGGEDRTSVITKPNGEPVAQSELTSALHALLDPDRDGVQGDQRAPWGIPVGAVRTDTYSKPLPGMVASQASARLLEDEIAEAVEAQAVLAS
jgi:hypothetical protein